MLLRRYHQSAATDEESDTAPDGPPEDVGTEPAAVEDAPQPKAAGRSRSRKTNKEG
ncbi:hypothetical protein OG946_20180 [Streptomyces sp. NBC_01808]|uniref:hypothetical protein n=1 Tax=Streptomyces sp. NBC_01808 TaxID=2975947 RepID=UPI002DD79DEB|nr:hypothetical protein [Streptomyces sp. NBC_01808]WSA39474.1 hypothetical protein OG946_20180 [Streptomyces sp. NBC_01808]